MRLFYGYLALAAGLTAVTAPSYAADYAVPRLAREAPRVAYIDRGSSPYCGPRCGCAMVIHVRHRVLERYYPSGFDPRTRDENPQYAYGGVRSYAQFEHPAPEHVLRLNAC